MPNQTVYLESGGAVGHLALNYDRKLNDWATLRIGYGRWFVPGRIGSIQLGDGESGSTPHKHARLAPMTVNIVPRIRPGSAHRVELGAGIVTGKRWEGSGSRRGFSAVTAMVGYRVTYRPSIIRLGMYYSGGPQRDFPQSGFQPALSAGYQF